MGISSVAKAWLRNHFKNTFLTVEDVDRANIALPKVIIIDFTYVTKYIGNFDSGLDYMRKQVLPEFTKFFERGSTTVILVFDRFSPVNKYEEHQARYTKVNVASIPNTVDEVMSIITPKSKENATYSLKNFIDNSSNSSSIQRSRESEIDTMKRLTQLYESTDPAALLVLTDLVIPDKSAWMPVIANRQLRKEVMHYITCSLVRNLDDIKTYQSGVYKRKVTPQCNTNFKGGDFIHNGYSPPPGCVLCIHGGQSTKPIREAVLIEPILPDKRLVVISNENIVPEGGITSGGMFRTKRTISYADQYHPPERLANLGEGEIACMYYSLTHVYENQLIVTSDGDTMLIALMASRFRLHADMSTFKNTVHVLLRVPQTKTKGTAASKTRQQQQQRVTVPLGKKGITFNVDTNTYENDPLSCSGDYYVDINTLYNAIVYGKDFKQYSDPISTLVMALVLMKNDFIKGFAPGLGGGFDRESETPWVLMPLLKNPLRYKNMVRVHSPEPELSELGRMDIEIDTTILNTNNMTTTTTKQGTQPTSTGYILKESLKTRLGKHQIDIDEKLFKVYVYECYYWKYQDVKVIKEAVKRDKEYINLMKKPSSNKQQQQQFKKPFFPDAFQLEDIDYDYVKQRMGEEKDDKEQGHSPQHHQQHHYTSEDGSSSFGFVDHLSIHDREVVIYMRHIKAHLSKSKREANNVMSDSEILSFARKLKWLLSYWTNGYIGDCSFPNPCETYQGESYYGWERPTENYQGCASTTSVSSPKPTERNLWKNQTTSTIAQPSSQSPPPLPQQVPIQKHKKASARDEEEKKKKVDEGVVIETTTESSPIISNSDVMEMIMMMEDTPKNDVKTLLSPSREESLPPQQVQNVPQIPSSTSSGRKKTTTTATTTTITKTASSIESTPTKKPTTTTTTEKRKRDSKSNNSLTSETDKKRRKATSVVPVDVNTTPSVDTKEKTTATATATTKRKTK